MEYWSARDHMCWISEYFKFSSVTTVISDMSMHALIGNQEELSIKKII
jgi:hypothetical protein